MNGLVDLGFADPIAARAAACRAKCRLRTRSIAARIGAAGADAFHHRLQADSSKLAAILDEGFDLAIRNFESRVGSHSVHAIDGKDVGHQQLLQCRDLILHLAEALLQILVHDSSGVPFDGANATADNIAAHRLSGDAK